MNGTYCTSSRQQENHQGLELLMLECRLSRLFRSPLHTDSQLRGISEASQSTNSPSSLFTQKPAEVSQSLQPLFSRRELASCLPIYQRLCWLRRNASLAVLWRWISSSLLSPLASHRPYPSSVCSHFSNFGGRYLYFSAFSPLLSDTSVAN